VFKKKAEHHAFSGLHLSADHPIERAIALPGAPVRWSLRPMQRNAAGHLVVGDGRRGNVEHLLALPGHQPLHLGAFATSRPAGD
jgi:hypothetical protein